jgi:hypothetical protein
MGKHLLREDKECQNCGDVVEKKYCPNCGQKNTETRQSFGHLFGHFIEDLTHYDTAFWKTIKYLLFRPARLTQEYLMGKRQSYVPPVKLYIFISFITFFLPAVLPDSSEGENGVKIVSSPEEGVPVVKQPRLDIKEDVWNPIIRNYNGFFIDNPISYTSVKQMDSIEALKPDSLRLSSFEHKMAKKLIYLYSHNTPEQVGDKFLYGLKTNIPKSLFVYLPIFAFWLWLFHGKKRWYYFDHGIFTLHYFSFLLLASSFIIILSTIIQYDSSGIIALLAIILIFFILLWMIYYFYRAHRKMYRESFIISFLKSSLMFIINLASMIVVTFAFLLLTWYNLH